ESHHRSSLPASHLRLRQGQDVSDSLQEQGNPPCGHQEQQVRGPGGGLSEGGLQERRFLPPRRTGGRPQKEWYALRSSDEVRLRKEGDERSPGQSCCGFPA